LLPKKQMNILKKNVNHKYKELLVASHLVLKVRKAAEDYFDTGLYCAESVVLALAEARGVESDLLPKIATAFCSGMGRTGGTCGALAGAIMGISLALGRAEAGQSVEPSYIATRKLIDEFEQAFGARDCHVLLGCDLATPEGQKTFRENQLRNRCLQFTGKAAEIAARILFEEEG